MPSDKPTDSLIQHVRFDGHPVVQVVKPEQVMEATQHGWEVIATAQTSPCITPYGPVGGTLYFILGKSKDSALKDAADIVRATQDEAITIRKAKQQAEDDLRELRTACQYIVQSLEDLISHPSKARTKGILVRLSNALGHD